MVGDVTEPCARTRGTHAQPYSLDVTFLAILTELAKLFQASADGFTTTAADTHFDTRDFRWRQLGCPRGWRELREPDGSARWSTQIEPCAVWPPPSWRLRTLRLAQLGWQPRQRSRKRNFCDAAIHGRTEPWQERPTQPPKFFKSYITSRVFNLAA